MHAHSEYVLYVGVDRKVRRSLSVINTSNHSHTQLDIVALTSHTTTALYGCTTVMSY